MVRWGGGGRELGIETLFIFLKKITQLKKFTRGGGQIENL